MASSTSPSRRKATCLPSGCSTPSESIVIPTRRLLVWQREYVQGVAIAWMVNIRGNRDRNIPGAPAAESRRDCDVLLAARGKRYRKALHRRPEPNLPKHCACPDIDG